MHELGITRNIVAIATEHAEGVKVKRITLEIGQLTAIMADAIQFCFDVCAEGTVLEGAHLEIVERPGIGQCQDCGKQMAMRQPYGTCECGSTHLDIIQGQELTIKEMETEALCV